MKYMGDREWWNERFKIRELSIMKPEKTLEEDIEYITPGCKILDLACGDGRNTIYLAKLGFCVTAVDFSSEAINRLKYFSKEESLKINTMQLDLSNADVFKEIGEFDAIIINHYRLNPELYSELIKHIKENGVLWVNGFREVPKTNPNITESDIFKEDDFMSLDANKLGDRKLYEIEQRKFVRYLWRK